MHHTHTHIYIYMCVYIYISLVGRVFANGPRNRGSIPSWVILKTQKIILDTSLLDTQHYKVCIKGRVEQSSERSSALPYTLVWKLLKWEPSGCLRLQSPTSLTFTLCLYKKVWKLIEGIMYVHYLPQIHDQIKSFTQTPSYRKQIDFHFIILTLLCIIIVFPIIIGAGRGPMWLTC